MNKSDAISKLAVALHKAHGSIKAVKKEASNPFFKSKYATLDAVVEAVKAPLLEQDIVVIQGLQDAEGGVAIETMLLHTSGEWISSTLRLPAAKEDAQGYGSACTYGRRYGLMAICGLPAEDDDGNAATATAPTKITPNADALKMLTAPEQATAKRVANEIVDLWNEGKELAAYEKCYQSNHSNEMILGIWEVLTPHSAIRNKLKKMDKEPTLRKAAA